jgi:O-antigen/teichoic acid export membrane protein
VSVEQGIQPTGTVSGNSTAVLRRRIARGSVWVFAGKVVASSLGLAVNAYLARLLPRGELGVYFVVFSTAMFTSTLAGLGLDRPVVRLVAASLGTGRPARARRTVELVFALGALGSLAAAAVLMLGLGRFLADVIYDSPALAGVIGGLAAWVAALTFQTLVAESFRGFQRYGLATISDGLLGNVVLFFALLGLWLAGTHVTLDTAVLLSVGATGLGALAMGVLLARRIRRLPSGDDLNAGRVLSISWPLLITNAALYLVGWGIDLWVVAAFRPPSDVALYGAAAKLVFFIAVPNLILNQVVPPFVAQLHAQGRTRELEYVLRSVATVASVPAFLMLAVFVLGGRPIMELLYGHFFGQGALVLAILCCGRLISVAAGPCTNTLTMTGYQRTIMVITITTGAASVLGGIALVHVFGIAGVAISTSTGQLLQNLLALTYVKRKLGVWTHLRFSLEPLRDTAATVREALHGRQARQQA